MVATTPTSYEAATLDLGIEMLAQSATFRTAAGAASPALARGFIVNGWGGDPQAAGGQGRTTMADGTSKARPACYAIVSSHEYREVQIALAEYAHSGQIQIVVVVPVTPGESAESVMVRGRNLMGAIRQEIRDQFGLAGRLLAGDLTAEGPSLPSDIGAKRQTFDFLITIDWRDMA